MQGRPPRKSHQATVCFATSCSPWQKKEKTSCISNVHYLLNASSSSSNAAAAAAAAAAAEEEEKEEEEEEEEEEEAAAEGTA